VTTLHDLLERLEELDGNLTVTYYAANDAYPARLTRAPTVHTLNLKVTTSPSRSSYSRPSVRSNARSRAGA
jgi:hypothetical protein